MVLGDFEPAPKTGSTPQMKTVLRISSSFRLRAFFNLGSDLMTTSTLLHLLDGGGDKSMERDLGCGSWEDRDSESMKVNDGVSIGVGRSFLMATTGDGERVRNLVFMSFFAWGS